MRFFYKERYLKRFDHFPIHEQRLILETDQQIRTFYTTRQAPYGLRIKLLHATASERLFEARVSRAIRILWGERGDEVSFLLVGLHNEVRNYLRSLR